MDNLLIIPTQSTPELIFISDGILMIKGNSHPVDVTAFYKPVFDWLEQFKTSTPEKVTLTFELEYIDTPSTRIILSISRLVSELANDKVKVKIIWKYDFEDDDMLDQGKIFETKLGFPFEFIEKSPDPEISK